MNNQKNGFLKAVCFLIALAIIALAIVHFTTGSKIVSGNLGAPDVNRFGSAGTSTQFVVSNTSVRVLATTTGRVYAAIVNDSAATIFLNLNGDKAALADQGIRLNPNGGSYEILGENLYYGSITAVASSSNGLLTVYEK